MEYTKEERINAFKDFITSISPDDKVAVIHHTDPDGISSGVIIAKTIGQLRNRRIDLRINQGHGEISVKSSTVTLMKENNINKVIIVDMSVDQQYSELVRITNFADVMIIDHHKIYNDLNSKKLILIKPQMLSNIEPSSYPAAKLCFDLCSEVIDTENLDWVASLGVIGDVASQAWKDFLMKVFAKYTIPF